MSDAVSFAPTTTPAEKAPAVEPAPPGESGILRLDLLGEINPAGPISLQRIQFKLETAPHFSRIAISINSGGGSVDESLRIYEYLRALPLPISARAESVCASGATTVFLAAAHRVAAPKTEFLLHAARRKLLNPEQKYTAQDLRREADGISSVDERLIDLLAARTGFDREWFAEQFLNEDYLSEVDLLTSGLVHEIEGFTAPCDPAWPEQARTMMAAGVKLPSRSSSANFFAACASAPAKNQEAAASAVHPSLT